MQDGAAVAVIRVAVHVVGARLDEDHPTVVLDAAGRRAIGLGLPLVGEAEELGLRLAPGRAAHVLRQGQGVVGARAEVGRADTVAFH